MLPVYEAYIPEDFDDPAKGYGVSRVSLVRSPAIEKDFKVFSHSVPQGVDYFFDEQSVIRRKGQAMNFVKSDAEQIVAGPAMLADTLIYRYDQAEDKEYQIFFGGATIRKVEEKFRTNPEFAKAFNLNHLNIPVSGTLQDSYVSGGTKGFARIMGFDAIPVGSWMMATYISDRQEWNDYIEQKYARGFSVEINLPMRQVAGNTDNQLLEAQQKLREFATPKSVKDHIKRLEAAVAFNALLSGLKKFKMRDQKIVNELSRLSKSDGLDYFIENRTNLEKLLSRYE